MRSLCGGTLSRCIASTLVSYMFRPLFLLPIRTEAAEKLSLLEARMNLLSCSVDLELDQCTLRLFGKLRAITPVPTPLNTGLKVGRQALIIPVPFSMMFQ